MVVGSATTVLVSAWWFFYSETQPTLITNKSGSVRDETLLKKLEADSDNDGLQDWEEALWKTNARNPDTDKDGTKDNDEILTKRDPRTPGPNDELSTLSVNIEHDAATATSSSKENLTAKLARNFTTAYFSRKIASASTGNALVEKDTLANQVFSDITRMVAVEDVIDTAPRFSTKDFRTSVSSSDTDVRDYINALGAIFQSASFPQKGDLEAITEAVAKQEQGLSGTEDLRAYRIAYEKLAEELKSPLVPQSLLETHTAMANNFWRLGLYLETFMALETDPIKSLAALNGYSQEGLLSIELLTNIIQEIKTREFGFSKDEGGSEFNKYLHL